MKETTVAGRSSPAEIAIQHIRAAVRNRGLAPSRHLDLSQLGLTHLPNEIARLDWLKSLDLSGNHLTVLPPAIGALSALIDLNVSENQLTVFPDALGELERLSKLTAAGNKLDRIPSSLAKLRKLKVLNLALNRFAVVPEPVLRLKNLETLSLSGNRLESIPSSIANLTQLRVLALAGNPLRLLPESIGKLQMLEVLDLSVENVARWLSQDVRGARLVASKSPLPNALVDLPNSLRRMRSLTALYLHGQSSLHIPLAVLGPTWAEVDQDRKPALPAMRVPRFSGQPRRRRDNAPGVVHGTQEAQEVQS